ncbi:hypothetical protein HD598_002497 [Neomicrococcus aestuarii]|uniref:Uncharacterized protein n=1 Tax=Neomicrococcus aestuarii TaxID=556325 RepID=A0A7W8TVS7_9MICC|nr:hypothetical protein [Neomicrococcus aestuarii]MBB5513810.1 hypothetical protein [Neomicrococcus aestuarii]
MRITDFDHLPERGSIEARGHVDSVMILPKNQVPEYSVMVAAQPAPPGGRRRAASRIRLIFMGQRRVPGIDAGTLLAFRGTVGVVDNIPTIYNPSYEILPSTEDNE